MKKGWLILAAALIGSLGAVQVQASETETIFIENDDHEVPAIVSYPDDLEDGEKVPAVVMLHGTGSVKDEVGNSYKRLAKLMAESGIASIRIDFMGSGESTAADQDFNFENAMSDAVAATEYIKSLDYIDEDRIAIMGWSQGGFHAVHTAAENEGYKAVVLWASGSTNMTVTDEQRAEAEEVGYYTEEYDWREPMHVGYQWILDAESFDMTGEAAKIQCPVLNVIGSEDEYFTLESVQEVCAACANTDSKTYVIEGGNHTFGSLTEDTSNFYEGAWATITWLKEML